MQKVIIIYVRKCVQFEEMDFAIRILHIKSRNENLFQLSNVETERGKQSMVRFYQSWSTANAIKITKFAKCKCSSMED
jgi:hypothetical protein